ncbi:MAG TPA: prepilin-type N-terminal cleavage/methylation domain-containing protein [Candidatus Elarobacter sp.]|nr:prepilin-type N-terminal cleavage/methylation domain-containing protein [Candidatus Elarobacter sp.]
MDSTRTAEGGFTLLELLVCIAILAIVTASTLGAFAAVARNATTGGARELALMAGENALARARAAIAYASSPSQDGAALLGDRSWGLTPGETGYVAGAQLRAGAPCGAQSPPTLKLPVAATYDAANERFTVVVTYPRDVCRVGADGTVAAGNAETVTLSETLPPSAYPPGQVLRRDIAVPARM